MIVLLFSCRTIHCVDQFITPVFIGYSPGDLDTIIVRKYKAGTDFQSLLDTAIITNNPTVAGYVTSNDTTTVVLNVYSDEPNYLLPGSDWQLYLPSVNLTISLSDIVSPQASYKCFGDDCECWNPINSYTQNGQEVTPPTGPIPGLGGGSYLMYINK